MEKPGPQRSGRNHAILLAWPGLNPSVQKSNSISPPHHLTTSLQSARTFIIRTSTIISVLFVAAAVVDVAARLLLVVFEAYTTKSGLIHSIIPASSCGAVPQYYDAKDISSRDLSPGSQRGAYAVNGAPCPATTTMGSHPPSRRGPRSSPCCGG